MAGRTLQVFLAADTKNFRSGMLQAEAQADGLKGKLGGLGSTLSGMLGPALIGAGAAAGALAVTFAVDGVKAAAEEEKELAKLTTTLKNLGFENSTGQVNDFIDAQARATTFSDSDLRPAFERLAGATKDVGAAMDLTRLATDLAVGAGVDLESASKALAKAVDGNTGALKKLVPGLDEAVLKSGDLDAITQALSDRFSGQAATAASTWEGQIGNLSEAFDELKESFGKGFLDALNEADTAAGPDGLTGTLYELQPIVEQIGNSVGTTATAILGITDLVKEANTAFQDWMDTLGEPWKTVIEGAILAIRQVFSPLENLINLINTAIAKFNELRGIEAASRGGSGAGAGGGGGGGGSIVSSATSNVLGTINSLQTAINTNNARNSGARTVLV
jgi:hypothetical protein